MAVPRDGGSIQVLSNGFGMGGQIEAEDVDGQIQNALMGWRMSD
jgi:hypothetical protein